VYLLVFHAYINEMHGSRSKILSKKISSGSCTEGFNSGVKGLKKNNTLTQEMQNRDQNTYSHTCFLRQQSLYYALNSLHSFIQTCYQQHILSPIIVLCTKFIALIHTKLLSTAYSITNQNKNSTAMTHQQNDCQFCAIPIQVH
jgi:hypothetical protein